MASIRSIKKDIDYLVSEVISDCYLTIYFSPNKKEQAFSLMEEAIALRNNLVERANHPAEKSNPHLVARHYGQLRRDLLEGVDHLFQKLSQIGK
ncbi:hypothetical protein FACS1894159_02420 [Bacteroidia bacterium]|nr:hypothetical protein FACS1894159_02420 [Bacteroidia bacterium]